MLGSLTPLWEPWIELRALGAGLAQPQLLWEVRESSSG